MIRLLGNKGQRALFGITRDEANERRICIACTKAMIEREQKWATLEALCDDCFSQFSTAVTAPPVEIVVGSDGQRPQGGAVTVSPRWDGFTYLNGYAHSTYPKDEMKHYCDEAERTGDVVELPRMVKGNITVLIVPNVTTKGEPARAMSAALMMQVLERVCSKEFGISQLVITQFAYQKKPRDGHLSGILRGLAYWNTFKSFHSLRSICIEASGANQQALSQMILEWRNNLQ